MRQRVVGGLAVLVDSSLGPFASQSTTMPSYDAYREFLQGEALYYRDPASAREHYTSAAALDSSYQWPVLRLVNNAFDAGDCRHMRVRISICYRVARTQARPSNASSLRMRCDGRRLGPSLRRTCRRWCCVSSIGRS